MTLAERAARFPEAWRPEQGDVLEGEVVEVSMRDSDFGDEPYPIVTVLDAAGDEWAVHAFHTMLRRQFAEKHVQPGDRVAVAYHGLGEPSGPGMSAPHRYRLVVERHVQEQPQPAAEAGQLAIDNSIPF